MVTKSLVTQPGGALARPKAKPAAAGLALINKALDLDTVRAMVDSERFLRQIQGIDDSSLDQAKRLHRLWLPDVVRAVAVSDFLSGIFYVGACLTQADASAMLHYLFGAMGKRRNDEATAKLMACVDIFNPASNALGPALGLWESAPPHPLILAITIKQLMATKTFEPAEAELREALGKVKQRLSVHGGYVWKWLERLTKWDAMLFQRDRAAWDQSYATVSVEVVRHMREQAEMAGEGPCEDTDANGNPEYPPSPRWLMLDDLYKAKLAAEAATECEVESKQRIAACEMKPAKRTRKPKNGGREHEETARG
jgi:hypothetical protein